MASSYLEVAFASGDTKTLKNVVIFRPGSHTDSQGRTKSFEKKDLQGMVSAFWAGIPESIPIKMGHSTDEFNQKVADALDLPKQLLSGEGDKQTGAVRLGEVIGLHLNGVLTADLRMPEKVADLVIKGFFTANSPEIALNRTHTFPSGEKEEIPITLSALSLLGAQRPAIPGSPSLQAGVMLAEYVGSTDLLSNVHTFTECDFSEQETNFDEGSKQVSASEASDGTPNASVWNVPIRDLGRGTFVQASVSAANEASAKTVALRVVENFLFNVGGPLGKVIGGALGILFARRLVVGKPTKTNRGAIGRIFWKFAEEKDVEEYFTDSEEITLIPEIPDAIKSLLQEKLNMATKKEEFAQHAPEGVSDERWQACLTKARADGIESPEAHCTIQLKSPTSMNTSEMAKVLGLEEWADEKSILSEIAKLKTSFAEFTEQDKSIKKMQTQMLTMTYGEETAKLTLMPGKPEELAERLVKIHQNIGADEAKGMLKDWQNTNHFAEQLGVTKAQLEQGNDEPDKVVTFEEKLSEWKEANPEKTEREATLATIKQHPRLYREYADSTTIGKGAA